MRVEVHGQRGLLEGTCVGQPLKMLSIHRDLAVCEVSIHFSQRWQVCLVWKGGFDRGTFFFCFVFFWVRKRK